MLESVLPSEAFSFPGVQGKGPEALSSFTKLFLYCLEQWLELASHSDAQGCSEKLLCKVEAATMRDKLVLLSQPHSEDQRYPLTVPCLIDELMLHARVALLQCPLSEGMGRNKDYLSLLFNMAGFVMASTSLVKEESLSDEQMNKKMRFRSFFLDCFMKHIFSVAKKNEGQISLKHSLLEYIFDPDAVSHREAASKRAVNTGDVSISPDLDVPLPEHAFVPLGFLAEGLCVFGPVYPKKRGSKNKPKCSSMHKKAKKNTAKRKAEAPASLFGGLPLMNCFSQDGMPVSGQGNIVPSLTILSDGADGAPAPADDLSRLSSGPFPTYGTGEKGSSPDCVAFDPCIYALFSLKALQKDPVLLKLGDYGDSGGARKDPAVLQQRPL
jgi:hypothetical protein